VFSRFGFTGGDPFAFYDDLVLISERMAEHQIPFEAISACAWATSPAEISSHLNPLIENGMTRFVVSHDPSHERWVSRHQVRSVVTAAVEMGLRTSIYGTFYDERSRLEDLFPELAAVEGITLESRTVGPGIGRMRNVKTSRHPLPNRDSERDDTCYNRVYHDVTVFWDGETYPCCSVYNRETPGISYGNLYAEPLWRIWDRLEGSLFLRTIKRTGFAELYALLGQVAPELQRRLPEPETAASVCHLCHLIMRDPDMSEEIHQVLVQEELARVVRSKAIRVHAVELETERDVHS
jgi:hypothetical protein